MELEKKMKEFVKWCRDSGMQFEGIEIKRAEENAGYGVFATRNFRPDEKLIVIPDDFMLTGGKVADMEGYSDIADRAQPRLTPFEMLTVFFAMEDPNNSEWGPYLKILPEAFDTPAYLAIQFTPNDVPLSSRDHLLKHQEELRSTLSKIQSILPTIPHERLLWAWHVVNTRCVYNENRHHPKLDNSEDDTVMVAPLIDMLNHEVRSQCVFLRDRIHRTYIVKANSTVMEGKEALVTYGPHSNARLWYDYGFRLAVNTHNKVSIPHELFFELGREIGLNFTELHENAIYRENFPCSFYGSDDGLTWQFRTNTKILLMSREEIEEYKSHSLRNLDGDDTLTKLRVLETSIRILEALVRRMIVDKRNSPQVVHWIWDEDIELLNNTIDHTRSRIEYFERQLAAGDNQGVAEDEDTQDEER